mmetsp:Transcript_23135/g.22607  ORF Transcript_23135/g.22607 Transcript_23135/m.22607 type:complete len:96 (-) Transcript_23135:477-764(-)
MPQKENAFATVSSDKFIRFYSFEQTLNLTKKVPTFINSVEVDGPARSLDFSPNGKFLALGYENGVFEVFTVHHEEDNSYQLESLKLFDLNRKYPI